MRILNLRLMSRGKKLIPLRRGRFTLARLYKELEAEGWRKAYE